MPSITVVAHNIRSAHNVGAIFRTCEGFGVEQLVLSGYTPYPTHSHDTRLPHIREKITREIHKTALGAESMVPFIHHDNILSWFDANTLPVVALELAPLAVALSDFTPPKSFALLLGEEVHGIEQSLLERCDHIVEIPMRGKKESFNVSVATGIALYALTVNKN